MHISIAFREHSACSMSAELGKAEDIMTKFLCYIKIELQFFLKCDYFYLKISFASGNLFVIAAVLCSADVWLTSGTITTRSVATASA